MMLHVICYSVSFPHPLLILHSTKDGAEGAGSEGGVVAVEIDGAGVNNITTTYQLRPRIGKLIVIAEDGRSRGQRH